jgi:hypothetical protein
MNTSIDVALILWNRDVIQLVSLVLLHRNLKSCGVEPSDGSVEDLILSGEPSVVVFDLAPPYDRSGASALQLQNRFPECAFVMTCADSRLALKKAPWLSGLPFFQKPYPLDEIANVVRSLVKRVPRSAAAATVSAGV